METKVHKWITRMLHRLDKIQGRLFRLKILIPVHLIQDDNQGIKKDGVFNLTTMERTRIIVNQIQDLVTISLTILDILIMNENNFLPSKLNSHQILSLEKFIPMYLFKKRKVTLIKYWS